MAQQQQHQNQHNILTLGCVEQMYTTNNLPQKPIVQIQATKEEIEDTTNPLMKCKISDGKNWMHGLLPRHLMKYDQINTFKTNDIFLLEKFSCSNIDNERKVFIEKSQIYARANGRITPIFATGPEYIGDSKDAIQNENGENENGNNDNNNNVKYHN